MGVRSARLAGPTRNNSGVQWTAFTVPAGQTYLVKRLSAASWGSGSSRLLLGIGGLGEDQVILDRTITFQSSLDLETWWAFEPGDVLRVVSSGQAMTVSFFGAILRGVA